MDKKYIQRSDPYKKVGIDDKKTRSIYYGEVVSINDNTDGGRIKVKILDLDNQITDNSKLPDCYPMLPKFFHLFPKVGEIVRVFIEDVKYPQRSRFWMGSIISQPQKINFDSIYTALSTTNMALTAPEPSPTKNPDAEGVFPTKNDVAIVGRTNVDIVLRDNQMELRVGKHENNNILKLNTTNPASTLMTFEVNPDGDYYSNTIMMSDKMALITHDGVPQFKSAKLTADDRVKIFEQGHPLARADVLVEALNIIRSAILQHLHPYPSLPADKNDIINALEEINFEAILQKNIVTN